MHNWILWLTRGQLTDLSVSIHQNHNNLLANGNHLVMITNNNGTAELAIIASSELETTSRTSLSCLSFLSFS